jgi:hypothetical protein
MGGGAMPRILISNLLGVIGAVAGGAVGFFIFRWLRQQGFYGLMIPGALLGLGCSLLARHASVARGVFCGLAALALALFTEWWFRPFIADDSLNYFFAHLKDLSGITILMTVIGALIAYWVGKDSGIAIAPRWGPRAGRTAVPTEEQSPKPE